MVTEVKNSETFTGSPNKGYPIQPRSGCRSLKKQVMAFTRMGNTGNPRPRQVCQRKNTFSPTIAFVSLGSVSVFASQQAKLRPRGFLIQKGQEIHTDCMARW